MHDLLQDQLQRLLNISSDEDIPDEWQPFIDAVDQTYAELEDNANTSADDQQHKYHFIDRDLSRAFFDSTTALVVVMNRNAEIVMFNPACERATGYKFDDVEGMVLWELFNAPQEKNTVKTIFQTMLLRKGDDTLTYKGQWQTRSGRTLFVEWSNTVLVNDDDEIEYIVATGINVTERHESEIERENLLNDLKHRTVQLKTAAAVSKTIVTILDPDALVDHTVNIIKDSFKFYYVGLFLVNEETGYAVLRSGTGQAGKEMLEVNHKLRIGGDSMIGQCVGNSEARIALDVGQEAIRFNNPFLPDTRSELALPMMRRGQCFGALTVQSTEEAAYSEEDITILQSMVDQVASALENARLFESARREIEEREAAQRELERSRKLLSTIIDTLPTYFHVKDLNGRFIHLNSWSMRGMYPGHALIDVLNKTDFDFFPEAIAQEFRDDELSVIRSGNPIVNKEEVNYSVDGQKRWFLTTKAALRDEDGRIIGTIGASQEITKQKQAEEALLEARDTLEERVKERTIQLEAANRELEAFAYSVSHDLRAPLRAINGFGQAIEEDYGDRLDEDGLEYLSRLRRASSRMGQLIDDLLTLSRVTRRELISEEVNLSSIASSIAQHLHEADSSRDVTFHIEPDLTTMGDERLLRVLLENLLQNAWKFTGNEGHGEITFGYNQETDEYYIQDNGVGFDMTYADKLFGAFQRLHTADEFEGTGIGLATVKRVILRHGGDIRAESEINHGATFYFKL